MTRSSDLATVALSPPEAHGPKCERRTAGDAMDSHTHRPGRSRGCGFAQAAAATASALIAYAEAGGKSSRPGPRSDDEQGRCRSSR